MPANKSSLKVNFMAGFNGKVIYQKCIFINLGNNYSLTGSKLHSTFLYSSIIITQLLTPGLKNELHLPPVSEMGKFYTLDLNFGG